jgi:AcrR family transcriptional regulator
MGAPEDTPARLKAAALRLFSERGIDGVSVRDIVAAAGQRNGASLHYHFGSKEGLIEALVLDGARCSEAARAARLEALEAAGGPRDPLDIIRLIIEAETQPAEDDPARPTGFGHMRFVSALLTNRRDLLAAALDGRRNAAYLRCLRHLRDLLPETPAAELDRRFVFLQLSLAAALAAREAAFAADPSGGRLWSDPAALDDLAAALRGLLTAPAGDPT